MRLIGLIDAWREPYHVVIEVENKQCKMVGKLASLGLNILKLLMCEVQAAALFGT